MKDGELVILTGNTSGKKPMLKIANGYLRKNNVGNIETELAISPDDLIINENGYIHTPDESEVDVTSGLVTLNTPDYISSGVKMWMLGALVRTYKSDGNQTAYSTDSQAKSDDDGVFHKYEWNQNSENLSFSLQNIYGDKTVHDITMWASLPGSYRKYSGTLTAEWDALAGQYRLSSTEVESGTKKEQRAKFDIASISSDKCDSIPVKITIPCDNPSGQVHNVFINTTKIYQSQSKFVINDWCDVYWLEGDKYDKVSEDGKWRVITLSFAMKSNLPTNFGQYDTAEKYNSVYGATSTMVDGCDLFNAIMDGKKISTDARSVNVAVNYEYDETMHTDYTKVIQPGYNDPRKIPDVKITLPNDIRSLENSNNPSLGVQANMFQFFVDIEINDFNKSVWGSFVPESEITLDVSIRNTPFDKEFADKYSIPNPRDTRTLHVNTVNPSTDLNESANNFVRFKTYVMEPADGTPYGKTQHILDGYDKKAAVNNLITAEDDIKVYSVEQHSVVDNSVVMTPDIFKNPDERRDGI